MAFSDGPSAPVELREPFGVIDFTPVGPRPTRWAYRVEHSLTPEELSALGDEGWELCAIYKPAPIDCPNLTRYTFKRPKVEAQVTAEAGRLAKTRRDRFAALGAVVECFLLAKDWLDDGEILMGSDEWLRIQAVTWDALDAIALLLDGRVRR